MSEFKDGRLYQCSEYEIMLYPDKESAAAAFLVDDAISVAVHSDSGLLKTITKYWSEKFKRAIGYIHHSEPFLVLHILENGPPNLSGCTEVLVGERKGFILHHYWLKLKEVC